jgi:hypothetical protein
LHETRDRGGRLVRYRAGRGLDHWRWRHATPDESRQWETFGAIVVALPVALLLFVLAPLIAGFVGGIVSHRIHAVAGSLIGVLVVGLLAVVVSGGPSDGTSGFGGAAAVGAVLVAAGHMTGVAIRPRASAT